MKTAKHRLRSKKISASICVRLWLISLVFLTACTQLEKPQPQPFYSQTAPPPKREFRWSNGKIPKSFDPALAAAPPETDVVRAIFEGLTDTDAKTLQTIPAVAKDWKSSADNKIWTFNLRKDARWSNGETVKAQDFANSWKRLVAMGEKVLQHELLANIVGARIESKEISPTKEGEKLDLLAKSLAAENLQVFLKKSESDSATTLPESESKLPETGKTSDAPPKSAQKAEPAEKTEVKFGVEAVDNFTLKVSLVQSDRDFPALVAHPMFRPIYGDGRQFETGGLNAGIVTNGAFRVFSIGQDGITLDRADYYWNRRAVELERVRFVPTENAEKALEAYRAGEIDAVTNADFEPLILKLLTPFDDFRRTAHGALNFYEINSDRKPFDDRRVRESLAIAVERERLTEDDMDGASLPALSFLPFDKAANETKFSENESRARTLLAEAGFPGGKDFPAIKLLINRNNMQQRIAKSVAKMWKQNLNVETEIIVKDSADLEIAEQIGDFDIIRRGVVLATTDETASISLIFNRRRKTKNEAVSKEATAQKKGEIDETTVNSNAAAVPNQVEQLENASDAKLLDENSAFENSAEFKEDEPILTEAKAVRQVRAIPLYFPTSYSLVKSYIEGFEINALDAPSLKDVRIDYNWQPKTSGGN